MKIVNLSVKFVLLAAVQLSISSCNNEDIADSKLNDSNLVYGRIYDGPPREESSKEIHSYRRFDNKTNQYCTGEDHKLNKVVNKFSRFGSVYMIWPGNIMNGNTLKTGHLSAIPIDGFGRNDIEVKVDGLAENSSQTVTNPTPGKVQEALASSLNSFYNSNTGFPAQYSIDVRRTFNSQHLHFALNIGFTGLTANSVTTGLNIKFSNTKNYYAVTLKQSFFTVSVAPKPIFQGDLGWIKKDYPTTNLSKDNNPVYISSVTYGRLFTLVYESEENAYELEQALNFAFKSPKVSVSAEQKSKYSKILNNSRVYVKQIGGNATDGLSTAFQSITGNFDLIREFVVKGAEVSRRNPGYPIEYTARNIIDNSQVTIEVEADSKKDNCQILSLIASSEENAKKAVDKLKANYGTGNSTKIIIHNDTNKEIKLDSYNEWYGSSFYEIPPAVIPPKSYGYTLGIHQSGASTGTFNGISYLLDNKIISFGTYSPWSQFRTNNVLVDFKKITETELYTNSTRPSNNKLSGSIRLSGKIDTGDSPFVYFKVSE